MISSNGVVSFSTNCLYSWSESCTNRDLSISQSRGSSTGIPQYIVQIVNTCVSGCAPSNIHLHCGWFASAKIVNPRTFKRLSFDDCLVNGGMPLKTSQIIRFTYSNSFMYPIAFKSAKFCWSAKTIPNILNFERTQFAKPNILKRKRSINGLLFFFFAA